MRISDWSSDVCSSDLLAFGVAEAAIIFDQLRSLIGEHQPGEEDADIGRALGRERPHRRAEDAVHDLRLEVGGQDRRGAVGAHTARSEEHTSELQSLMRISYAVFCLDKKINTDHVQHN